MSGEVRELRSINPEIVSSLVLAGDLKRLSPAQKVEYYNYRCAQAGLDPSAKPFDLLTLNGKEVLYANAACTQQLTQIHKLSHQVTNRELVDGIYCVFVRVTGQDGRSTENMGAVPVENLKGEAKANAMLKATTKAIRRSVLAHCGLGMLDETEVETIPGAKTAPALDPPIQVEWTDEERDSAKGLVNDLAEVLLSNGFSEAETEERLKHRRGQIGDVEVTYDKWCNRCAALAEKIQKEIKARTLQPTGTETFNG